MMLKSQRSSEQNPDKKTLSIIHLLHPYVKQRIRVGEILGVFPKNMYKSNEVIDEVVVDIYENSMHKNNDHDDLRLIMFEKVNGKLSGLFETEEFHKNSISTKIILEDELNKLDESFTMDADNDLIMNEDLEDISYHQNNGNNITLPYDEAPDGIRSFLELVNSEQEEDWNNRSSLRKVYYTLPLNTTNVVDLYILGKLSFHEIGIILNLSIIEVKEIIRFVKETFKNQLE